MGTKGYDSFFTKPFEKPGMTCRVCGSQCDSRRSVRGPTSFGEAMSGVRTLHDSYSCPHSEEPWHMRALELAMAIHDSPSPSLQEVMKKDLQQLVAAHLSKPSPS